MPTIEQAIGAGETISLPGGEQFHLLTANADVTVTFYEANQQPMETWEDMRGGLRIAFPEPFMSVRLYSATAQTVKCAVTSGNGVYARSQGDVSVLSGTLNTLDLVKQSKTDYYDSLTGQNAFVGGGTASAVASEYSYGMLSNPVASGKTVIVKQITVGCLADTSKIGLDLLAAGTISDYGKNKYAGGAAGLAGVGTGADATSMGTNVPTMHLRPDDQKTIKFDPAIVLPESKSLKVENRTVNTGLTIIFEWLEA